MKTFLVIIIAAISGGWNAFAAAPSETCQVGYIAVRQKNTSIKTDTCPSGYSTVGTPTSCLSGAAGGECMMFVPAGKQYSDETGIYEYTSPCPLK